MPVYDLQTLNCLARSDPERLVADACARYRSAIRSAAETVASRLEQCPVVLLSGPSSSGKTTTAALLAQALQAHGIRAHRVSMDDYYLNRDDQTFPRLADGSFDLESPYGLDLRLIHDQMRAMAAYRPVDIPWFDFANQRRDPERVQTLHVHPGDAVILEGIHALNTLFTEDLPDATRVYVCVDSDFALEGEVVFSKAWIRFLRRAMRDRSYRGCEVERTLHLWRNVLDGEQAYIAPFAADAHIKIDTTHAFEPGVLMPYARRTLLALPRDVPFREMVDAILDVEPHLMAIDPHLVPEDSLLRTEFVEL